MSVAAGGFPVLRPVIDDFHLERWPARSAAPSCGARRIGVLARVGKRFLHDPVRCADRRPSRASARGLSSMLSSSVLSLCSVYASLRFFWCVVALLFSLALVLSLRLFSSLPWRRRISSDGIAGRRAYRSLAPLLARSRSSVDRVSLCRSRLRCRSRCLFERSSSCSSLAILARSSSSVSFSFFSLSRSRRFVSLFLSSLLRSV